MRPARDPSSLRDSPTSPRARIGATLAGALRAVCFAGLAASQAACVGLSSEIEYPENDDVDLSEALVTPEGDPDPSVSVSSFRINPKVCEGFDMHVITQAIDQEDLTRFFGTQKLNLEPKKARSDLYWYEFPVGSAPEDGVVRLRLAILKNRSASAKDLHDSLLQHGPGWWGVRRGNLALLAPKASLSEALRFAIKTKLVCWGMFTYQGVDDVYVTTGGYSEF
jgi:hypothetical protein